MKAKYILTMLAASLATASVAQEAPKTSAILTALATPSEIPSLSADQRASKMGSLALVPADVSFCVAMLGLSSMVEELTNAPIFKTLFPQAPSKKSADREENPLTKIKDIVVVGSPEFPSFLKGITPLMSTIQGGQAEMTLKMLLNNIFKQNQDGSGVVNSASLFLGVGEPGSEAKVLELLNTFLENHTIASGTVIVSMEEKTLDSCKTSISRGLEQFVPMIAQNVSGITIHKAKYSGVDFSGIHLNGQLLAESLFKEKSEELDAKQVEALAKGLAKHNLYILFGYQGDKMIVSISEDPSKNLKLASTAQESILSTDKLGFADKATGSMFITYMDRPSYSEVSDYQSSTFKAQMAGYIKGLEAFAHQAQMGDISGLIVSLKALDQDLSTLMNVAEKDQPFSMLAWWDKGFQMEASMPNQNNLAEGQLLKLMPFADSPDNIFFSASNSEPKNRALEISLCENFVDATWQFVEQALPLYLQTANKKNENVQKIVQALPLINMMKPELLKIWGSAKLALSGMNNESFIIIDNKGALPMVPCIPADVSKKMEIPRIAFATGVTDRNKLATAWNQVMASTNELIMSLNPPSEGDSNEMMIPQPKQTVVDGVSTYSFACPFFTKGFTPSVSVSDGAFVIGTSPEWNQSIAKALATPVTGNLKGAVLAFKMDPTIAMIKSTFEATKSLDVKCPAEEKVQEVLRFLGLFQGMYATMNSEEGKTYIRFSLPMK